MIQKIDFKATKPVAAVNEANPELQFGELAAAWLATVHEINEHCQMRKWLDLYGDRIAWTITTAEIDAAGQAMLDHGYAASTVNRNVSTLGSLYKWARDNRKTPAGFTSPTLSAKRHTEEIRVVAIDSAKLKALRDMALTFKDRRFTLYVHLLIDTGARKSELLERSWSDVDLDRCEIILATSKTGVPRVLHFTPATAALIRRFAPHRPEDGLLFPGRVPSLPICYRKRWLTLVKSVGLPDLHQHDIRHNRARQLIVGGVGLPVAASIMGHSSQVLARRYGHLDSADNRRAVEAAWSRAAS